MRHCVVTDCEEFGIEVVAKPTSWGVWEYRVCDHHKAQVDDGAFIQDNPDGVSITLHPTHSGPGPENENSGRATDVGDALHSRPIVPTDADGPDRPPTLPDLN